MPDESENAVAARCGDCCREFYVVDEPASCPHCGGEQVDTDHGVVVRPC